MICKGVRGAVWSEREIWKGNAPLQAYVKGAVCGDLYDFVLCFLELLTLAVGAL